MGTQDIKRLLFEEGGLKDEGRTKLERLVQLRLRDEPVPEPTDE